MDNNNKVDENIFKINPKELKKCIFEDMTLYARVYKCYDADTISVIFNHKGDYIKYNCRLNRIDTPEMRSKNPKEKEYAHIAQKYLSNLILEKIIKIKITGIGKYGRLLTEVYYFDEKNKEININDLLIEQGYAKLYDGGTKSEWVFV